MFPNENTNEYKEKMFQIKKKTLMRLYIIIIKEKHYID